MEMTPEKRIEIYNEFEKTDWSLISKELVRFGIFRLKLYGYYKAEEVLPKGNSINDVIQEVIIRTIEGRRKWDPEKGELLPWLRDQLKSVLDCLVNSAAAKHEKPMPVDEEGETLEESVVEMDGGAGFYDRSYEGDPLESLIKKEDDKRVSERISTLFEVVVGDTELEDILLQIMDGCDPAPRSIAQELKVSVEYINNGLKRLRRKAKKLIRKGETDVR